MFIFIFIALHLIYKLNFHIEEVLCLVKNWKIALNEAFREARKRHEFMTVEHLVLCLLNNISARDTIVGCGGNIANIKAELLLLLSKQHLFYLK